MTISWIYYCSRGFETGWNSDFLIPSSFISWTIDHLFLSLWIWLPGVSTIHSPSPRERSFPESQPPPEFVPPAAPPGRHQWVPDESESVCMVCCRERFTMFNRRHHCRRCGRLVCSACSTKKMAVEGCRESPTRVCDQCYSYYNKEWVSCSGPTTSMTSAHPPSPKVGGLGVSLWRASQIWNNDSKF